MQISMAHQNRRSAKGRRLGFMVKAIFWSNLRDAHSWGLLGVHCRQDFVVIDVAEHCLESGARASGFETALDYALVIHDDVRSGFRPIAR